MENQVMSSSTSSTPQPVVIKAVEVSKEIAAESINLRLGFPQESMSRSENPGFRSGPVPTGSEIMKLYPSKSNKIYTCHFCNKGFSTSQALGGHQNAHKQERDWDKKRKEMEANFPGLSFLSPYLDKPHLLLGGYSQDALSNDNHLGITLEPLKRPRIGGVYPSFNSGLTNVAIVPRITPSRFFTGTNGSSSMGLAPRSSYNNNPPMIPRNMSPFPPPPRTTNPSNVCYSQKNALSEENLISKVGNYKIVEIDDDDDDDDDNDQPEEGTSKSWGIDLSLSL